MTGEDMAGAGDSGLAETPDTSVSFPRFSSTTHESTTAQMRSKAM